MNKWKSYDKSYGLLPEEWNVEKKAMIFTRDLINKKNISSFADIGASLGYYTKLAIDIMKDGIIYSFEPDNERFDILEKRCKIWSLNKNTKIIPFNIGMSNIEKEALLYTRPGHSPTLNTNNKKCKTQLAKFTTLDNMFSKIKIELIKMDVEREELNVLKGGIKIINKWKPSFIIELHKKDIEINVINFFNNVAYKNMPIDKKRHYYFWYNK